jgi:hypothetical protein
MITLEEILFNSLAPWASRNIDDFLFEELNAKLYRISAYWPGMYFTKLRQGFQGLGLESDAELEAEWKFFAGTDQPIPEGLFRKLSRYRHSQQKVHFYAELLSNCGFAELNLLKQDFEKHPDFDYQRYTLRKLCSRLERIIRIPNPDTDHTEEDLTIIKLTKLTAVIMYLEIIVRYSRHIHAERLKLPPDEVFEELARIAMTSQNAEFIVKNVKTLYYPYFRTGPIAYVHDTGMEPRTNSRTEKKNGMEKTNDKTMGTKFQKSELSAENKGERQTEKNRDRIIGTGEARKILGCSSPTLARWRKKGIVPYSQPNPDGRCYYRLSEITELGVTMRKEPVKNS